MNKREEIFVNHYQNKDRYEIIARLHDACNLRCDFCLYSLYDIKKATTPIKLEEIQKVIDNFEKIVKENISYKFFSCHIFGGELFSDNIPDEAVKKYYEYFENCKHVCEKYGNDFELAVVTNLIHHTTEKLTNFITNVKNNICKNITLLASFDFYGRFHNKLEIDLFMKNFSYYHSKGFIGAIGFVLTKQCIDIMLGHTEDKLHLLEAFNKIYNSCPVTFNWYEESNTLIDMLPTEQDIVDWYKYVLVHYPKIREVGKVLAGVPTKDRYCTVNCTFNSSDGWITCEDKALAKPDIFESSKYESRPLYFLNRYKCDTCKYFTRCISGCPLALSNTRMKRLDHCMFREIIEYADSLKEKEKQL